MTAHFITFEGGEGAGKSTQIQLLADALRAREIAVLVTREPGGTGAPAAEFLRDILLRGDRAFAPLTEMMLHFAARAEHVTRTIRPTLAAGTWVLSDRFFDSTEAYQVHGQGADPAAFEILRSLIVPHPQLTFVLAVSPDVAAARQAARGRAADRYDRLGAEFHARVAASFATLAAREPARCVTVDANGAAADVAARILAIVEDRFP